MLSPGFGRIFSFSGPSEREDAGLFSAQGLAEATLKLLEGANGKEEGHK